MKKHIFFILLLAVGIYGSYFINLNETDFSTDADRVSYIENYGWSVEKKAFEHEKIKIPMIFDDTLLEYNNILKRAGYDLMHYKGAVADRYSYRLLNHPIDKKYALVNVFVYQNNIIAADVVSPKINGSIAAITDKE